MPILGLTWVYQFLSEVLIYLSFHLFYPLGDNDAVRVLLLIPSLLWKSEILLSQLKEKYPAVESNSITHADLVRSHAAEQFVCRAKMSFHLFQLQVKSKSPHDAGFSTGPLWSKFGRGKF